MFPYRSLISMPRPLTDEKQLQSIETLSQKLLRTEFEDKLNVLRMHIGNNLKPKRSGGVVLTLEAFIGFAEEQCKALNEQKTDFHSTSFFVEMNEVVALQKSKKIRYAGILEEACHLADVTKAKDWAVK